MASNYRYRTVPYWSASPTWLTKNSWPPIHGIGCFVDNVIAEGKLNLLQELRTPLARWWYEWGKWSGGFRPPGWQLMGTWNYSTGSHPSQAAWPIGTTQLAVDFVAGWWFRGGSEEPCCPDRKLHSLSIMPFSAKSRFGTGDMDICNLLACWTEPQLPNESIEWERAAISPSSWEPAYHTRGIAAV